MFALSLLEHKLRVPAYKLDLPLEDAIRGELESIFLDKVIAKLGLCVSIYDIKSIDGGFVLPNEGSPTYTVVFRVIMFRPYKGEIIAARLKESNTNGLRLSLGFFDDIYVPVYALPSPRRAEPLFAEEPEKEPGKKEKEPGEEIVKDVRWVWEFNEDFYIEGDDEIRFQVTSVSYPPIPLEQKEGSKPFAPMVITGSIDSDGLGPTIWWSESDVVDTESPPEGDEAE